MALHVEIGGLEIDERKREARRDGRVLAVQPKVFDVLLYLIRERERVVSRDELQRAVWGNVAVATDSVSRALREARRLLGDDARRQSSIRTYPGKGIRLVAAVVACESPSSERTASAAAPAQPAMALVGQRPVLEALDELIARGHGIRVVVGPPGSGKSALLGAVVTRAGLRAVRVRSTADARAALDRATTGEHIVVVVDDLEHADAAGTAIADLVRVATDGGIALVAACGTTARGQPAIEAVIATAVRADPAALQTLEPLDRAALQRLADRVLGRFSSPAAIAKLARASGGNPRLALHILCQVQRLDRPLETLDGVSPALLLGASEVVRAHVAALGATVHALLEAIAPLDVPFTVDLAAEIAAVSFDVAADAIEAAHRHGVLARSSPTEWTFAQDLVRVALADALSPSQRAPLHARAAVALERRLGMGYGQLDRLAHHYHAGASAGVAPRALELLRRAAAHAIEEQAFALAARHLERALEVEALLPANAGERRALWLQLGACQARDGNVEGAATAFAAADALDLVASPDGRALRAAFVPVAAQLTRIVERFYELLFARHPSVQAMFVSHSARRQQRMFGETVVALVTGVDDAAWFDRYVRELGRRHVEYGVTAEMYGWTRDAFLDAIVEAQAPRLVPDEVLATWAHAFDAVARRMLAVDHPARDHAGTAALTP